MATFAEVVYQICWQAQKGLPPAQRQDISSLLPIAESLIPSIFQRVGETAAGDEGKRSLLKKSVTLTFSNGSATIPSYVLKAYLKDSTFYDADDLTKSYSWVREFFDFASPNLDSRLGYYNSPSEEIILVTEPGVPYEVGAGEDGDRIINIPCVPVKPAAQGDTLDVDSEILNEIYDLGAAMLQGEMVKRAAEATIT